MASYKDQIKVIRRYVKRHAKGVSVRRGRGTAYSYIEIEGSGRDGTFTKAQREGIKRSTGISPGGNFAVISPEKRKTVYTRAVAEEERRKRKR